MTFTCIVDIICDSIVLESSGALNVEATTAFFNIVLMLGLEFAYFLLSEWITSDLLEIGDFFYNSTWYGWPTKQQKLLEFPIRRAQRELRITGLGLFKCSLAVFASVSITIID